MFDSNLILVNGSAAWTYALIVTAGHGIPVSTTRNAGGFAVVDLGKTGATGISVVAFFPTLATSDTAGALALTIEACDSYLFGSAIKELLTFGGATIRVIVKGEVPAVFIGRVSTTLRYIRAKAVVAATDDYKLAQVLLSPYPFNVL